MTQLLSEKAGQNLLRNEESRRKDSKYVKLQPGEKETLQSMLKKMEPVESRIRWQERYTISHNLEVI